MAAHPFWHKSLRIMRFAVPYWHLILWLFIISVFLTALSLVSPYLVKILIDDILIRKDFTLLYYLMLLFIALFFLKSFVQIYTSYQTTLLAENIINDVKTKLFQHLENLDLGFFYSKKIGDILVRLEDDVYGIESFIGIVIDSVLMNVLTTVFILGICLYLNWQVTLASLTFFPFYVISQKYFGNLVKKKKRVLINKGSDMLSFLQENIVNIQAIKSFVLESIQLEKYKKKNKNLIRLNLDMSLLQSYSGTIVGLITFTPLIVILWYGSYKVITGVITVGELMALYTYIGKLFGPVSELGSINIAIQSTMVSVNRVFEFLDTQPHVAEKKNAKPLNTIKGNIGFSHVQFRYVPAEPVLHDVTFKIMSGESVGLVGPSGAGKTTVASLIARFFDPLKGKITLDNNDLRDVQLFSLRKNIGYVSQETILFNASLRDNIRMGKLDATDGEIEKAAKLANIHEFIVTLRKKYNTLVGERGVNLSGGQKQRISIARAILKNPKIIILDEATSSLDSESEEKVQEALDYATKGKTTIIIAHRLSTIKNVDKIIFLKEGVVAEQGSFTELLEKQENFAEFYHTQVRGINNFKEHLATEWKRMQENNKPLSLITLSIANFDELVKERGNDVAISLAVKARSLIETSIRNIDFMAEVPKSRYNYYIVMPEMDVETAEAKIKGMIARMSKALGKGPVLTYQVMSKVKEIKHILA